MYEKIISLVKYDRINLSGLVKSIINCDVAVTVTELLLNNCYYLNEFVKQASAEINPRCIEHVDEPQSHFCHFCKCGICDLCARDGRHSGHDVQLLTVICKQQKVNFVIFFFFFLAN